jgi:hypothetical protein
LAHKGKEIEFNSDIRNLATFAAIFIKLNNIHTHALKETGGIIIYKKLQAMCIGNLFNIGLYLHDVSISCPFPSPLSSYLSMS